jgi:hypothetical protein
MLRADLPPVASDHLVAAPAPSRTHAVLLLALFEAVRALDLPPGADLDEFHRELTTKRLGTSPTVAAQIARYDRLVMAREAVDPEELVAVLRLLGRRADARLVFADGGRRAGRHAVRLTSLVARAGRRLLPGRLKEAAGFRLAQRAARRVLGVDVTRNAGVMEAWLRDPAGARATPDGAACGFYGSAIAELLRAFTSFDGAMFHTTCRARGDAVCRWRGAPGGAE